MGSRVAVTHSPPGTHAPCLYEWQGLRLQRLVVRGLCLPLLLVMLSACAPPCLRLSALSIIPSIPSTLCLPALQMAWQTRWPVCSQNGGSCWHTCRMRTSRLWIYTTSWGQPSSEVAVRPAAQAGCLVSGRQQQQQQQHPGRMRGGAKKQQLLIWGVRKVRRTVGAVNGWVMCSRRR